MKMLHRGRRLVRPLALALALSLAPAAATTAPASATSCAEQWGSLVKSDRHASGQQVTDVRSGRHACFDRLVIDLGGDGAGRTGYYVKYVHKVAADGSGTRVRLRGGAKILIVVNAPAYDAAGHSTYLPEHQRNVVDVSGYDTFRQVAWANTFEGQTTFGLGVRARLPMRVFLLSDPGGQRIVVDVAHSWS